MSEFGGLSWCVQAFGCIWVFLVYAELRAVGVSIADMKKILETHCAPLRTAECWR